MSRLSKIGKGLALGTACVLLTLALLVMCVGMTWAVPLIFVEFFDPGSSQETVAYAYLILTSIVGMWLTHRIASRLVRKYILK
jgi:hypothetical protein